MKRCILYILVIVGLSSKGFAQTQPTVLVEGFTNIDCTNCPIIDGALDAYDSTHSDVIAIWVHSNFPNPHDPMYLVSKSSSDARAFGASSFWTASAEPQAYVNGSNAQGVNGWQNDWKPVINSYEQSSGLSSSISITLSPRQDSIQLLVHCSGTVTSQVTLNVDLVESGIYYDNSGGSGHGYGNPPGDIWNNVLRKILPTPAGTAPFTLSGSKDFAITIDTTGTGWKIGNMKAVAFLQDVPANTPTSNANVEGIAVFSFATLGVPTEVASEKSFIGVASPNPFNGSTELPITIAQAAHVRVTVSDLLGREVTTPVDRFMAAGRSSVFVNGSGLPPGLYQARMYVDGALAGTTKLMNVR